MCRLFPSRRPASLNWDAATDGGVVVDAAKMFQLIDRIRPRPLAVSTTPSSARLREEEKKKMKRQLCGSAAYLGHWVDPEMMDQRTGASDKCFATRFAGG